MKFQNKVYLSLGANIGDKESFLINAIIHLNNLEKLKVNRISKIYETKPMGEDNAENYLNGVVECITNYSPAELLEQIKNIEKIIGRKERRRWSSREIDIDILLIDDLIYSDEKITIPHKGLTERDFVLLPLLDLISDKKHPALNKNFSDIYDSLNKRFVIKVYKEILNWNERKVSES